MDHKVRNYIQIKHYSLNRTRNTRSQYVSSKKYAHKFSSNNKNKDSFPIIAFCTKDYTKHDIYFDGKFYFNG